MKTTFILTTGLAVALAGCNQNTAIGKKKAAVHKSQATFCSHQPVSVVLREL